MKQHKNFLLFLLPSIFFALSGCGNKQEKTETIRVKVPVTITKAVTGPIAERMILTATSSYQKKNIVSASIQGYVLSSQVSVGDHVAKGQPLFVLQTKESHALNNTTLPDSLKTFTGKVTVSASEQGIVTSVSRQSGDYVQDGEQLCMIADIASFAFVLSVPYDYTGYVRIGETCDLILPDSTHLPGRIDKKLSTLDAASQTQNYLVVLNSRTSVPENIIAQARLSTKQKNSALLLPKQTILADETMRNFWVMKLVNDTTAVKVIIEKGMEEGDEVEIISPTFSPEDRFLLTGNYGLEDTAFVTITRSGSSE
jgi:biotin carboxyl carrier protein